jgi:hypothetical protein
MRTTNKIGCNAILRYLIDVSLYQLHQISGTHDTALSNKWSILTRPTSSLHCPLDSTMTRSWRTRIRINLNRISLETAVQKRYCYLRIFVESARWCGVDVLIVSDRPLPFTFPPNVRNVMVSWNELVKRVQERVFRGEEGRSLVYCIKPVLLQDQWLQTTLCAPLSRASPRVHLAGKLCRWWHVWSDLGVPVVMTNCWIRPHGTRGWGRITKGWGIQ